MLLFLKSENSEWKDYRGVDEGHYNLKYGHEHSIVTIAYKFPEVKPSFQSDNGVCDTS